MNIIKIVNNQFERFVDIRKEFPNIDISKEVPNIDLPEDYKLVKYEDVTLVEGTSYNYSDVPVFENGQWILKVIYTPVEVVVPQGITPKQARLGLLSIGKLEAVEQLIANADESIKDVLKIEWSHANEICRHHQFIEMMAPMIGLTEQDVDNLFINASKIK